MVLVGARNGNTAYCTTPLYDQCMRCRVPAYLCPFSGHNPPTRHMGSTRPVLYRILGASQPSLLSISCRAQQILLPTRVSADSPTISHTQQPQIWTGPPRRLWTRHELQESRKSQVLPDWPKIWPIWPRSASRSLQVGSTSPTWLWGRTKDCPQPTPTRNTE
jgi:hypothetical protein